MIVRVLKARIRANRVGAFNALFRGQVALLQEQPGLVYVKLARRLQPDGSQDAILFEEWEDAASLYAWVGPNLNEPRLVPGTRELIDEVVVAHYEALDREAADVESVEFARRLAATEPVSIQADESTPDGSPAPGPTRPG